MLTAVLQRNCGVNRFAERRVSLHLSWLRVQFTDDEMVRGALQMILSAGSDIPRFLVELEDAFNEAMVSNDVQRIAQCVTDDWVLVTPEAGPVPRARILDAIASGRLTHATMTKVASHACVVGDMAWVTGRGQNTGTFNGSSMHADEYITDIYRREGGQWRCMLTHLTPVVRP